MVAGGGCISYNACVLLVTCYVLLGFVGFYAEHVCGRAWRGARGAQGERSDEGARGAACKHCFVVYWARGAQGERSDEGASGASLFVIYLSV